jgi:hypothetical protein
MRLARQAAGPARQAAAPAARSLPATAWARRDLPRRDLSALALRDSYQELGADFVQVAEIARPALTQALVSRQKR